MNKFIVMISFCLFSTLSFAGGKVIGNGGDSRAMDFYNVALESIKKIKDNEAKYPEVKNIDLEAILEKTEILVSEVPVYSLKGELRQFSTVINFKNPDTIVIYGPKWNDIKNKSVKYALALHEVLSLAGIEETGSYLVSNRFLASAGVICSSGLCENIPRFNCSLYKMPFSTNKHEKLAVAQVGYAGTSNEIVNVEAGEMKVAVVMSTGAANGHILITLYQNGKTVGISEMQGTNFPSSLQLKWKDTLENVAYTVSCQQN